MLYQKIFCDFTKGGTLAVDQKVPELCLILHNSVHLKFFDRIF